MSNQNTLKLVAVMLFSICMASCRPNKDGLLTIDPLDLGEEPFTLSFLANDIEYVPFSDDVLFPAQLVYDYSITETDIFLSAPTGVLRFDRNGDFIGKIGSRGRGPEEYLTGLYLTVNNSLSNVYILGSREKIFVYDFEGHYVRNVPIQDSIYAWDIEMYFDKMFISCLPSGYGRYYWLIIDTMGVPVASKLNPAPPISVSSDKTFVYRLDDNIYYWDKHNDTIFSVSPDLTYKPVMLFANKDLMVSKNISTIKVGDKADFMIVNRLFETSKYVVLDFFYNERVTALIDKRNGKKYASKIDEGILNDIDGGPYFEPRNGCFEEDGVEYLVSFVDAYTIKNWVKSEEFRNSEPKFPEKKKKLEELANGLEDNDNPVMVLVRLK